MKNFLKKHFYPIAIGFALTIFSVLIFKTGHNNKAWFFSSLDFQISNIMFKIRGEQKPSKEIVIIDIDDKSLEELGQWPWPRKILSDLLLKIQNKNPKVIGIDIIFPERDRTSPHNLYTFHDIDLKGTELENYDEIFGDSIEKTGAITGYIFKIHEKNKNGFPPFSSADIKISNESIKFKDLNLIKVNNPILNIPEIAVSPTEGFLNIFPEPSGTILKAPLLLQFNNIPYPSLALEIYRNYKNQKNILIHPSTTKVMKKNSILAVGIGKKALKTDIDASLYINFKGRAFSYKYISATDILKDNFKDELDSKIILIGTSASGLADLKATPFSPTFPGVEIHASIIDNMLNNDYFIYDRLSELGITYTILIGCGILITLLITFSGPLLAGILTIFSFFSIFTINYFFLFKNNQLIGVSYPGFSILIQCTILITTNYFLRDREKKFIKNAFSHYIAPEVVNEIIKDPEKLSLSGKTENISILFSDIRSFTSISENLTPEKLSKLLNIYLTEMSDIIMTNKGVVDKFIGDAVMAFWGAPLQDKDHGYNSVKSAFLMLEKLKSISAKLTKQGYPKLEIGIGINSGEVRIGNFGSKTRFDYTIIGDNVNTASRLEGLNKFYGTKILISKSTENLAKDKILTRKVDSVKVKGKDKALDIYEVMGIYPWDEKQEKDVSLYNEALFYYENQELKKAEKIFKELIKTDDSKLNQIYIERIEKALADPAALQKGPMVFKEK